MQSLFNIMALFLRCSRVGGAAFLGQLRKEGKYIVPFVKEVKAAYAQSELPHEGTTWQEWMDLENKNEPVWAAELRAELGIEEEEKTPEGFPDEEFMLRTGQHVTVLRDADDQLVSLSFKPALQVSPQESRLVMYPDSLPAVFQEQMGALRKVAPMGAAEQRILEEFEEEHAAYWKQSTRERS